MFQLADDSHVGVTLAAFDDASPPNQVPMPSGVAAAWASSDPSVLTVAADPADSTGLTGVVTATGKLGTAQVQCTVTMPDGSTKQMTGGDVEVIASALATIGAVFGAPAHN